MSAAALALLAAPSAGAATVPAVPQPATVLTVFPWEGSMEDELQGTLCQAPNNCVRVDQFLWDPKGIATIEATIDATPGTKVVFSYSEGARTVTDWLIQHAADADAPSADELSFVVIGNPTRAYGGSDSDVMPQTQYRVIDISRQYDFASDFPDNPLNLVTLLNSLMAFTTIHTDYEEVNMYDPANIVWQEGNTTYVFVPTENLPLLAPLRNLGLTGLADALNAPLKALVERGYDRSYLPVPAEPDPVVQTAAPAPDPKDVEHEDSVKPAAAVRNSDADDDADDKAALTAEVPDGDTGGVGDDEKTETPRRAKHSAAARTEEAGAESTGNEQKSDQSTDSDRTETRDTKRQSGDDSSPSDKTSGDE